MSARTGASAPLVFALLADARLPTGAHAQSAGLEPALLAGLDPGQVPGFCRSRLRTTVRVEAATACVARARCVAGTDTAAELEIVEAAWAARTPSPALRNASRQLGRGYERLGRRLWPEVASLGPGPRRGRARPVVFGLIAAAAGLSADETAFLCAYDDVQTVAAASSKLLPGDPLDLVVWILGLDDDIQSVVRATAGCEQVGDIPGASAPRLEALAEVHAQRKKRLFHV